MPGPSGKTPATTIVSAGLAGREDLEILLAWGRARRPRHILGVFTGEAAALRLFAGVARRVIAVDLTETPLRAARESLVAGGAATLRFVAADAAALPFTDACFDTVTCRLAAHHFREPALALRQMARVLTPGGSLLLQDLLGHDDGQASAFMAEVERRRDPSHVKTYRGAEWKAFLRAAGLTIIEERRLLQRVSWAEWTQQSGMSLATRRDLETYVRSAPEACRDAFDFRLTADGVDAYTTPVILLRADRD